MRELSEIISSMQPSAEYTVASSQSVLALPIRTRGPALYFYVNNYLFDVAIPPLHQIVATFYFNVQFKNAHLLESGCSSNLVKHIVAPHFLDIHTSAGQMHTHIHMVQGTEKLIHSAASSRVPTAFQALL